MPFLIVFALAPHNASGPQAKVCGNTNSRGISDAVAGGHARADKPHSHLLFCSLAPMSSLCRFPSLSHKGAACCKRTHSPQFFRSHLPAWLVPPTIPNQRSQTYQQLVFKSPSPRSFRCASSCSQSLHVAHAYASHQLCPQAQVAPSLSASVASAPSASTVQNAPTPQSLPAAQSTPPAVSSASASRVLLQLLLLCIALLV